MRFKIRHPNRRKTDRGARLSQGEASQIVAEVHQLVRGGDAHSAWERIRDLHPADIGSMSLVVCHAQAERCW